MDIDDRVNETSLDVPGAGTDRLDVLFRQLSHPARRNILVELLGSDDEIHYSDLNAAASLGTSNWLSLHHTHLPQLATAGYIEWDVDAETIARGPAFESVAPAVEQIASLETYLPGTFR